MSRKEGKKKLVIIQTLVNTRVHSTLDKNHVMYHEDLLLKLLGTPGHRHRFCSLFVNSVARQQSQICRKTVSVNHG